MFVRVSICIQEWVVRAHEIAIADSDCFDVNYGQITLHCVKSLNDVFEREFWSGTGQAIWKSLWVS